MINILGLRLLTRKDYNEIMDAMRKYRARVSELAIDIRQTAERSRRTDRNVFGFMDFVSVRMPLKRHRKEARQYFPADPGGVWGKSRDARRVEPGKCIPAIDINEIHRAQCGCMTKI